MISLIEIQHHPICKIPTNQPIKITHHWHSHQPWTAHILSTIIKYSFLVNILHRVIVRRHGSLDRPISKVVPNWVTAGPDLTLISGQNIPLFNGPSTTPSPSAIGNHQATTQQQQVAVQSAFQNQFNNRSNSRRISNLILDKGKLHSIIRSGIPDMLTEHALLRAPWMASGLPERPQGFLNGHRAPWTDSEAQSSLDGLRDPGQPQGSPDWLLKLVQGFTDATSR